MAGGTSFYFAYAINQLPKDITFSLVTAMDPTETEPVDRMRKAGINVMLNASRNTVFFENRYFGENQNERKQRVLAKADPFTIPQLKDVEAKVYHLGSLLSDDFSPEVVEYLATKGRVSIDVQGYLREVRDEKVYPVDWQDKLKVLKNTYYLKVNETEMETITGKKDPREAALLLHSWGVTEVIITLGSEGIQLANAKIDEIRNHVHHQAGAQWPLQPHAERHPADNGRSLAEPICSSTVR